MHGEVTDVQVFSRVLTTQELVEITGLLSVRMLD